MPESSRIICNICGKNAVKVAVQYKSYTIGEYFDIYECANCDASFVDINEYDLTRVYQNIYANANETAGYNRYYYYQSLIKKESDPLLFLSKQESMYWSVKESIKKLSINKNDNILEIGSGLGYLTYSLAKKGYKIKGVDISENAVNQARSLLGDHYLVADVFTMASQSNERYNFIILNEVIEHVENPKAFIRSILDLLDTNGKLLVTTPNKSIRIPGVVWDTDLPPVHLWWLSATSMKKIAVELSCNISFLDFTRFNKQTFDKARFRIYKSYKREPIFDKSGSLLNPAAYIPLTSGQFKHSLQLLFAKVSSVYPFSSLLTRKEYPININSTLACIFSK